MSKILDDVKHQLGIVVADTAFDQTVQIHINSVFAILNQLGVGPAMGFMLETGDETWDEFFTDERLNAVKSYVYLRVKLLFDPPTTGFVLGSYERQIQELEFRLNAEVDF
jgi:hypothetical protein